jgi:hypothetical protein
MGSFFHYISHHLPWLTGIAALLGVILVYIANKADIDFWFMDLGYRLPIFGKVVRLGADRTVNQRDNGFLHSEVQLCDDYEQHIQFLQMPAFDQRMEYLRKADDNGRHPVPLWLQALLILLIAAEGYGFSYLLAPFFGTDVSENARQLIALALVIVLCICLVLATHHAGHHWFINNRIRSCERAWDEKGRPGDFDSMNISLYKDQSIDDFDEKGKSVPHYKQCINRVGKDKNHIWVVSAISAILALGILQVGVRMYMAQSARIEETASLPASSPAGPSDTVIPDFIRSAQQQADQKAVSDHGGSETGKWFLGSLTLLVIYVLTQGVGLFTGYAYGFAGKNSLDAFKETHGAASYEEYRRKIDRRIAIAEARLAALHQEIQKRRDVTGIKLDKTFEDYLWLKRERPSIFDPRSRKVLPVEPADPAVGSPEQPEPPLAPAAAPPPSDSADATAAEGLDETLARIDALTPDEAKGFIRGLPADRRVAVQAALKARKAAATQLDKELDDLLGA